VTKTTKITPPKPIEGLDDFPIYLNAFEMGAFAAASHDFVAKNPDKKYIFARILKQIDEFYVRDKFGDEFYEEKYAKEQSGV